MNSWIDTLLDIGVFADVRAAYKDCLDGSTPGEAAEMIYEEYGAELMDEDDGPFVHLAVATAQLENGRLNQSAKRLALAAIEELKKSDSHFADDPDMMQALSECEKAIEKGRIKRQRRQAVKCTWKTGDVYVTRLENEASKELGIYKHYVILRMAEPFFMKPELWPNCYVSISSGEEKPVSEEDVAAAKYLKATPRNVYRMAVTTMDQSAYDELEFVGNFPDILPPENEYVIPNEMLNLLRVPLPVDMIEEIVCNLYRRWK